MKVKIENSFEVEQSNATVWKYLMKPMDMAECIPGVSLEEKIDERTYKGKAGLKFGPVSVNYNANVVYEEINEAQKNFTLVGKGVDTRGAGSADMRLKMQMSEVNGGRSKVDGVMEITISGKIAQFGSRLVVDASNELFKQFVSNFKNKLNNVELSDSDKNVSIWKVIKSVIKSMFKSIFRSKK